LKAEWNPGERRKDELKAYVADSAYRRPIKAISIARYQSNMAGRSNRLTSSKHRSFVKSSSAPVHRWKSRATA
jgi:hypothetical protein